MKKCIISLFVLGLVACQSSNKSNRKYASTNDLAAVVDELNKMSSKHSRVTLDQEGLMYPETGTSEAPIEDCRQLTVSQIVLKGTLSGRVPQIVSKKSHRLVGLDASGGIVSKGYSYYKEQVGSTLTYASLEDAKAKHGGVFDSVWSAFDDDEHGYCDLKKRPHLTPELFNKVNVESKSRKDIERDLASLIEKRPDYNSILKKMVKWNKGKKIKNAHDIAKVRVKKFMKDKCDVAAINKSIIAAMERYQELFNELPVLLFDWEESSDEEEIDKNHKGYFKIHMVSKSGKSPLTVDALLVDDEKSVCSASVIIK